MARRQEWEKDDAPIHGEDDGSYDPDAIRRSLVIRLARLSADDQELWRRCPVGVCRRKHACSAPDVACDHLRKPPPPISDAEADANWAKFRAALEARVKAWREGSGGKGT